MPIVLCVWCEYIGSGDTIDDQWNDVERHERIKHRKEIAEEY